MLRKSLLIALTLLALAMPAMAAPPATSPTMEETAAPATIDHPRRIVLSLSERDLGRVNEVIGNIGNIQRYYGADNVRIALVVYGAGIHTVLRDESSVEKRIAGLIAIGIEILGCEASMTTLHKTQSDLIPGVHIVPNGLPEIVERQVRGWIYVRP